MEVKIEFSGLICLNPADLIDCAADTFSPRATFEAIAAPKQTIEGESEYSIFLLNIFAKN